MNNNLTDAEIIKALECCGALDKGCQKCLYNETFGSICIHFLCKDTLDLINRQQAIVEKSEKVQYFADKTIATLQAENKYLNETINNLTIEKDALFDKAEELKAEIERLKTNLNVELENFATEYDNKIKVEAYKECIEKVRKLAVGMHPCSDELRVFDNDLDNLLKELMGENNN